MKLRIRWLRILSITILLSLTSCNQLVGRYFFLAGMKLYHAGNYAEAIKGFDGAIKYNYQLLDSYCMRGLAHYQAHEYDLAIADSNEALAINRSYAPAFNSRALSYYRKGETDKAIADMEQVLKYSDDQTLRAPIARLLQDLKAKRTTKDR